YSGAYRHRPSFTSRRRRLGRGADEKSFYSNQRSAFENLIGKRLPDAPRGESKVNFSRLGEIKIWRVTGESLLQWCWVSIPSFGRPARRGRLNDVLLSEIHQVFPKLRW